MRRHPWPPDIIVELVANTNTVGALANSNLNITAFVLHEATLLEVCPDANMDEPNSGSNNTPTVFWSTRDNTYITLKNHHTWGCPAYVLYARLQGNISILKN